MKPNYKFHFYHDPGHGWLRVPRQFLIALQLDAQISGYSYTRGRWVYLEEDRDALIFARAWEALHGTQPNATDHYTERQAACRNYERYTPAGEGGAHE